jgi:hypothetical protein
VPGAHKNREVLAKLRNHLFVVSPALGVQSSMLGTPPPLKWASCVHFRCEPAAVSACLRTARERKQTGTPLAVYRLDCCERKHVIRVDSF